MLLVYLMLPTISMHKKTNLQEVYCLYNCHNVLLGIYSSVEGSYADAIKLVCHGGKIIEIFDGNKLHPADVTIAIDVLSSEYKREIKLLSGQACVRINKANIKE